MKRQIKRMLACGLCYLCTAVARADLYRDVNPGGNFDLSNWYLRLPVDENGGTTGTGRIVRSWDLVGPDGFRKSPYFYTDSAGGMVMYAPIFGARSGTSPNARCEMREMIDPHDASVNWDTTTESLLLVQGRVLRVPSNGKMIIGQVHGYGNGQTLLGLQYEYDAAAGSGKVTAVVINDPVPGSTKPRTRLTVASGLALNKTFSYRIRVLPKGADGSPAQLSIVFNNAAPSVAPIDPAWDSVGLYFAAGAYPQDHEGSASEAGSVVFYQFAASHPANALSVRTPVDLPKASASIFYQTQLAARGGIGSASWSLVSGHPPDGITLSPSGLLSGKAARSEVSSTHHKFTVRATDSTGATADKELRLVVGP